MSADFLDSNVILYCFDVDEAKRRVAGPLVASAVNADARISFQVVQEVLYVLMRRAGPGEGEDEAGRVLSEVLWPLCRIMPSEALYRRGFAIRARYGYGFYDALIIAAALEAGCDRLLSEDFQAG